MHILPSKASFLLSLDLKLGRNNIFSAEGITEQRPQPASPSALEAVSIRMSMKT